MFFPSFLPYLIRYFIAFDKLKSLSISKCLNISCTWKPSLVVEVDFGTEIGIKKSSAQITHYYNEENLVGKQVIAVCNFPKKNIAGIFSEVLILGAIEKDGKVVLVHPSQKVQNGLDIA